MSEQVKTTDTSVTLCGVRFKNPIITASGTFGFGKEYANFYDLGALGGICTKGLTKEKREGNPSPRIAETPMGMLNSVGLQNPGIDGFIQEDVPFLDTLDTVVIANVAGRTEEDYCYTVEKASALDCVKMVELNISCPNVKAGGMAFGVLPASVEKITAAVKKHCRKPLMVKLSPNVANIADNARAAENGGADCLSLINTVGGMAIDWRKRKPVLANVCGGLSGPAIKPIALKMVYETHKAVQIPIVGIGGIMTADDIMEFLVAGASAVQVGSANIFDPEAAINLVNELTNLMKKCNINTVREVTGSLTV
ncbi:MAG: dihydroorotate dehydrogenase [Clostridia bacterium]|nr:dihydroorotate dehydrogenase [Clostridia bacterium]